MKIDFKSRFKNKSFIVMFITSVILPILIYFKIEPTDLTSWNILISILIKIVKNPYVIFFTIWNIICLIYDPLSDGIWDNQKINEVVNYEHIEDTM